MWPLIIMALSFSSLAHSQPSNHFDPLSLSPLERGKFLLTQSLYDQALRVYQSLIADGIGGEYAFRGLVQAYKGKDDLDAAKIWIDKFLLDNPNSSPALYASGYIYYLKKDMGKADDFLNQALESDSNNALALNNMGAVLLSQKLYVQALSKVQEAIRINPKESMFFDNLRRIYKKMGDPSLIVADYNYYLEQGGPLELIKSYGMAASRNIRQKSFRLYSEGHLDKTIAKWMDIEKIYKKINHQNGLVPVYFSLGLLHEEKGDTQNAKKYFNRVLKLNPMHIQAKEKSSRIR
jgi:tetratricopeptide (TPR) repeat protein